MPFALPRRTLTLIENGDVYAREFRVTHVLAQGKRMVFDGALVAHEAFLEDSNREIALIGEG